MPPLALVLGGVRRHALPWAMALALLWGPQRGEAQDSRTVPALRGALADAPARTAVSEKTSQRLPAAIGYAQFAPDLRLSVTEDDEPLRDEADNPDPVDQPSPQDGDMTSPDDAAAVSNDGVVQVGEPPAPKDGADPALFDSRPAEEADLFTLPGQREPAGYDPLLFQIEDIDPLRTDRRPGRLFTQEPYDPVGVRFGSFVYFPEVSLAGDATSNALRQPNAQSDVAAEFAAKARLVSNWSVHALEFSAAGLTSFYNEFPSENDADWYVEARGRLDVTRKTNIQAVLLHDVRQEDRGAIDAVEFGDRAQIKTDTAALSLNHRFNRLSVQLRGGYDNIDFGSDTGSVDDRDVVVTAEAARATWQFRPTFSVFGEVETNQRDYNTAAVSDGFSRDSDGQRYRAGIDFRSTGQVIRGEMSLGYGTQKPSDPGLSDVDGVLIDANVAWRISDPTTLRFIAATDMFDTNTPGSSGVLSHTIGFEARHAFRRYVIATAGLAYTDQDYDNVPISEQQLRASLLLEYYVNREWTLFGQWERFDFNSNQPDSDWVENDVRLGARWRQ